MGEPRFADLEKRRSRNRARSDIRVAGTLPENRSDGPRNYRQIVSRKRFVGETSAQKEFAESDGSRNHRWTPADALDRAHRRAKKTERRIRRFKKLPSDFRRRDFFPRLSDDPRKYRRTPTDERPGSEPSTKPRRTKEFPGYPRRPASLSLRPQPPTGQNTVGEPPPDRPRRCDVIFRKEP